MLTRVQDLRDGARMLARSRGYALVAIATLALGIGANTSSAASLTMMAGALDPDIPVSGITATSTIVADSVDQPQFFAVVVGVFAGAVLALAAIGIQSLLFGVDPVDPFTFAATTAALLFAAVLACLVPARRAVRVDPIVALPSE